MNIGELAKFRGGVSADTISELTAASGVTIDETLLKDGGVTLKTGSEIQDAGGKYVKIKGGDGADNPATGYVGNMLGTERTGTNGKTYSTETSTAATTAYGSLVSITLNKGVYLITAFIQQRKAANTNIDLLYMRAYIGGTAVLPGSADEYYNSTPGLSGYYQAMSMTFPCVISADSTAVAIYGKWGADNGQGGRNTLTAIRIG